MPPKNPVDKKAADAAHEIEQRLQSHQAPLAEARAELAAYLKPSTGENTTTGEASTASSRAAPTSSTTPAEPLQTWQAAEVLNEQKRRLAAAEERFQEFARTNNWARAPVMMDRETIERLERRQEHLNSIRHRVLGEAQQALNRADNSEHLGPRRPQGLNPDAPEFYPGR